MCAHRESDTRQERCFVIAQQVNDEIAHILGRETLSANPNYRGRRPTSNGQNGVEVCIERHDDPSCAPRFFKNHIVSSRGFRNFGYVNRLDSAVPQQRRRTPRQSLIQQDPHHSVGHLFGPVLDRGRGVEQGIVDGLVV